MFASTNTLHSNSGLLCTNFLNYVSKTSHRRYFSDFVGGLPRVRGAMKGGSKGIDLQISLKQGSESEKSLEPKN